MREADAITTELMHEFTIPDTPFNRKLVDKLIELTVAAYLNLPYTRSKEEVAVNGPVHDGCAWMVANILLREIDKSKSPQLHVELMLKNLSWDSVYDVNVEQFVHSINADGPTRSRVRLKALLERVSHYAWVRCVEASD